MVFTTPYIVLEPGLREWQAYFRRTLLSAAGHRKLAALAPKGDDAAS